MRGNSIALFSIALFVLGWSTPLPAVAAEPNVVQVALEAYEISMPKKLPPGPTRFVCKNVGKLTHSFAIKGGGIDASLPSYLQPGDKSSLEVDLVPGKYEVWCPVGNHRQMGMELTLTVAAESSEEHVQASPNEQKEEHESESSADGEHKMGAGWPKFIAWLGKFHPAMVNFPIALIIAGAFAEFLYMRVKKPLYDHAAHFCVRFGGLAGLAAAVLGWFFAGLALPKDSALLATHRWFGTATGVWILITLVLNERCRKEGAPPGRRKAYRFLLFVAAVLVLVTGFFGGSLLYGLKHYAYTWPS